MRWLAHSISILSHPLFGVTYLLLFLLAVNPYLFGVNELREQWPFILLVFGSSAAIPGLAVLMMVGLEMVPSVQLSDKRDRIIPLISVGMFYLGLFVYCQNSELVPAAFTAMLLGATAGLFLAFFLNLFSKISLHAVSMGGLAAGVLVAMELFAYGSLPLRFGDTSLRLSLMAVLLIVILMAGLVGAARLYLGSHRLEEIFGGYLAGFTAMLAAVYLWF